MRRLFAGLVAIGLVAATAFLSRVPVSLSGEAEAMLRLSWRTDAVPVESCRAPTEEESSGLPVHMRATRVCSGGILPFRLRVRLDERDVVDDTVAASGARGDRPLYVFREVPLAPGRHRVEVSYDALGASGVDVPAEASSLEWEGAVDVARGQVVLLTLDPSGRVLELR